MASQIAEEDVQKYEKLLSDGKSKLTALRAWKDKPDQDKSQFDTELQQTLGFCKAVFGILRDEEQFQPLADELAETIVNTRNYLGPDLMPLERYHVFNRGIFEVNNQTIISGQYYEELPFYGPPRQYRPDPSRGPQISKFYEWKIIDSPRNQISGDSIQVKCIYYLEKGDMDGVYYVLGYSAPGMHATVQLYGQKPNFFEVEKKMLQELQGQSVPLATSSRQS